MIVSELYGQTTDTDSVKISVPQFFAMERIRRDHELLKVQFMELQSSNLHKQTIIDAQMNQIAAVNTKFEASQAFSNNLEIQYRKKRRTLFLYKIGVPMALVAGFWLGGR